MKMQLILSETGDRLREFIQLPLDLYKYVGYHLQATINYVLPNTWCLKKEIKYMT